MSISSTRHFLPLFIPQFFSAFNDKLLNNIHVFCLWQICSVICAVVLMASSSVHAQEMLTTCNVEELGRQLEVGDIVFIHVDVLPFRKIARDTGSWTNHVGIIIDTSG